MRVKESRLCLCSHGKQFCAADGLKNLRADCALWWILSLLWKTTVQAQDDLCRLSPHSFLFSPCLNLEAKLIQTALDAVWCVFRPCWEISSQSPPVDEWRKLIHNDVLSHIHTHVPLSLTHTPSLCFSRTDTHGQKLRALWALRDSVKCVQPICVHSVDRRLTLCLLLCCGLQVLPQLYFSSCVCVWERMGGTWFSMCVTIIQYWCAVCVFRQQCVAM